MGVAEQDLDPGGDLQVLPVADLGPWSQVNVEYLGGNFNATVRTDGLADMCAGSESAVEPIGLSVEHAWGLGCATCTYPSLACEPRYYGSKSIRIRWKHRDVGDAMPVALLQ